MADRKCKTCGSNAIMMRDVGGLSTLRCRGGCSDIVIDIYFIEPKYNESGHAICSAKMGRKQQSGDIQYVMVGKGRDKRDVPFLGLPKGEHLIQAKNGLFRIKIWLSMYGWAWRIMKSKKM